jgi:hypothetical protein
MLVTMLLSHTGNDDVEATFLRCDVYA